jgi:hypothetical protein
MQLIIIVYSSLLSIAATAQSFSEKISKEYSFEKRSEDNMLMIANLNGSVNVVGYDGDKVILEINKTIHAKTDARLENGKQELQLGVIDLADTLIFYIKDGCSQFGNEKKRNKWNNGVHYDNGWSYQWSDQDKDCREVYDYKMDFTIKVPASIHLIISTINDGNISVEKVNGIVKANNINGGIKLSNLSREANASTINGDVDIDYSQNPQANECRFYSLNGDINAYFPKGLGAELSFDSFNGEFYTNMDKIAALPAKVVKSGNGEGIRYKVSGNHYQVGSGGVFLDFETFNGNVYLKEK